MSEQAKLIALLKAKISQLFGTVTLVIGVTLTAILLALAPSFRRLPSQAVAPQYAGIAFLASLMCITYGAGSCLYYFNKRRKLVKELKEVAGPIPPSLLEESYAGKESKRKKQTKTISSTITFDDQPLTVKGEVEREPWKDRLWIAGGCFYFCNKISLTIENKGNMPVNTGNRGQPIVLDLDVRGEPNSAELFEENPSNPELILSVKDGKIVLEHVQIDPNEKLKLSFVAWFAVQISEL